MDLLMDFMGIEFSLDTPGKTIYCLKMASWRKNLRVLKAISLMLVYALVLQFMLQLQVHVHHDHVDIVAQDDHVIDYHMFTDVHTHEPDTSDEVHELKTTPDIILKKTQDWDFNSSFLVLFLVLAAITRVITKTTWEISGNKLIRNFYYGLAPPSRAPPAI